MASFRCPECHKEKTENVTGHILSSVLPTITCTCECGHIYQASLEWRDADDTAGGATDTPEVAPDTPESGPTESVAMPSDGWKAEVQEPNDVVLDSPLTMDSVGPATVTCPNCGRNSLKQRSVPGAV